MSKYILLCGLTLLVWIPSGVGAATVKGTAPDWAGTALKFVTWTDPVTRTEKPVFSLKVGPQGHFSAEIDPSAPLYCFADFGIFRGKLVLVPGEDLTIKLPPFRDLSYEERKNPYFEPVEVWLSVETASRENLTNSLSRFDNQLNRLSNRYFNQLYLRQQKDYLDTITNLLDQDFGNVRNAYFQTYRMTRLKALEADLLRNGREKTIAAFRHLPPSDYVHPGFTVFLNRLFINSLSLESNTPGGSKIRQWVTQKNTAELLKWTGQFTSSAPPLSEIVLLKMLYDAFYSGDFPGHSILEILRSAYFSGHGDPVIRHTALAITDKLTFLIRGSTAPAICLPTTGGSRYCSTSCTAPYQYILFADLEIPVCREQVKYLTTMIGKTGSTLSLLLVLLPSQQIDIPVFVRENQIPGIVVTDLESGETGNKYQVRSYPSAFLLNKEHKVVLAPARTPLDGFEFEFAGLKK